MIMTINDNEEGLKLLFNDGPHPLDPKAKEKDKNVK